MAHKRGNNEGSITKRKDGRWEARITTVDGSRKSLYGRTRSDVAKKLTTHLEAERLGNPLPTGNVTVYEFLEEWLESVVHGRVRASTFRSYEAKVRLHLIPAIGGVRLRQLTPAHIDRMMQSQLRAGVPPQSVAHIRAVLRNALNTATRWGLISRNVVDFTDPPRVAEREVRPLTPDNAKQLLATVDGDRLEALFTVALAVGLRQSEALGLRWCDVDFENCTVSVRRILQQDEGEFVFLDPKTVRSRRTVAVPEQVIRALREHRARQLEERLLVGAAWEGPTWHDLVFCNEVGAPLAGHVVSRRFKKLRSDTAFEGMRYHDLRHAAASLLAVQGVPPRVAMEILGHAQISTTMEIYAHVAPEVQRDAAIRMGNALWAQA